ncbi:hypothetical protein DFH09DRAFT_1277430 [Mycena vulgaris]|nr:hypothetical protein DFH09DRAFT_1277430 [Mycena vulgaris]
MRAAVLAVMFLAGAAIAQSMFNTPNKSTAEVIGASSAAWSWTTPPPDATDLSSSSYPGDAALSPCASDCITAAAPNSACLITTNVTCLCQDMTFLAQCTSCLQGGCHAAEMRAALDLLGTQCATASLSVSTSQPTSAISLPPSTDTQAADISFITSATTAHTSPTSFSVTSRTPIVSLSTVGSADTSRPPLSSLSSVITSPPTSWITTPSAAPTVTVFQPSAAYITISAGDASPATTAIVGASNAISLGTGMGMALAVLFLGAFASL